MLYYLFDYLDKHFDFPGAGVFQYITFRAIAATITSLGIAAIWGKTVINMLRKLQIGEDIRDLGLEGQMQKKVHLLWVALLFCYHCWFQPCFLPSFIMSTLFC
jgi:hypothetical protein